MLVKIAALKYRLPPTRRSNEDVVAFVRERLGGRPAGEVNDLVRLIEAGFAYAGSRYRYWLDDGEPVLDHAIDAARDALAEAGLRPQDVSAIIYVGVGRGCLEPASAAAVQMRLGAVNATSFDILEACVSWVRGLEIAQALFKAGRYCNVLLVNCEMGMRRFGAIDELRRDNLDLYFSALTVGEAATATVLLPGGEDFDFHFRTWPEGFGYCMIPLSNARAFMPDQLPENAIADRFYAMSLPLVNTALKGLERLYGETGYKNGPLPDLTLIHSVSERASRQAIPLMGLDWDRHFDIHASHGNTVSASIPLGMALAAEAGRLAPGTDTLLIGAGAGVSTGFCRFVYQ